MNSLTVGGGVYCNVVILSLVVRRIGLTYVRVVRIAGPATREMFVGDMWHAAEPCHTAEVLRRGERWERDQVAQDRHAGVAAILVEDLLDNRWHGSRAVAEAVLVVDQYRLADVWYMHDFYPRLIWMLNALLPPATSTAFASSPAQRTVDLIRSARTESLMFGFFTIANAVPR